MDIKAYISSGILEQYALQQLSPPEVLEVEQYASQYPEVQEEIESIQQALEVFAKAAALPPRPALKQKVIDKIKTEGSPKPKNPEHSNKPFPFLSLFTLFCLFSLIGLGWLYNKSKTVQQEQATAFNILQKDCNEKEQERLRLQLILDQLMGDRSELVKMKGTPAHPGNFANVIYNATQKETLLQAANLPAPPAGQQYQLWALKDGLPIDLGVFDVAAEPGFITINFVESPDAFAVTLEPLGGSETPTLSELRVIGELAG